MAARIEDYATQLEQAHAAVIAAVQQCSDTHWLARCPDEGWTVAATAQHIARGHAFLSGLVQAMANGQPLPPITMEAVDRANAQAAAEHERCDRDEALALLRANGERAVAVVRALSEDQLSRSAPLLGTEMTTAQVIEDFLIAHPRDHVRGILAAS